jgi:dUTP pyrophosphatase
MLLTSEQISKFVKESPYSKRTQAGIDLSVMKIQHIQGGGAVYVDTTIIDPSNYIDVTFSKIDERICWRLTPGVYSVTFNEGINIPADCQAKVTHRSSIYRMGNIIESPWWDAGFYCDNMNTTLIVNNTLIVEKNARLAQVVFWRMENAATELYNGQFQGLSSAAKAK